MKPCVETEEVCVDVLVARCQPRLVSPAVLLHSHQLWMESDCSIVSCRLEEINGFFARNDEEYLALIFEKEGSYLGREVSLPRVPATPG